MIIQQKAAKRRRLYSRSLAHEALEGRALLDAENWISLQAETPSLPNAAVHISPNGGQIRGESHERSTDDDFINRFDLNADGALAPIDVLIMINLQSRFKESRQLLSLDYSDNGVFDLEDISLVLNTLNALNSGSGTPLNAYGAALSPVTSPTRGIALGEPPVTEDEVYGMELLSNILAEATLENIETANENVDEHVAEDNLGNNCCTRPLDEESIKWSFKVDFLQDFDQKVTNILQQLPLRYYRPFASLPPDVAGPIILSILQSPIITTGGFDDFIRRLTIEDIARLYFTGLRLALESSSSATRVVFGAARDKDLDPACGCNMTEPKVIAFGPRVSVSGNFSFEYNVLRLDTTFRNDHRYPQNQPGANPNDTNYDKGNLVDEFATARFEATVTFGVNLDLSFLASGVVINQTLTVESDYLSVKLRCREGTVNQDLPLLHEG